MCSPVSTFTRLLLLTAVWASVQAEAEPNPPTLTSRGGAWPIRRQWTPAETTHFAAWVEGIYQGKRDGSLIQRNANLMAILNDARMNRLLDPTFAGEGANPPPGKRVLEHAERILDCGKLTVVLPAYYACVRALPWMVSRVELGDGDVRTAPSNTPTGSISTLNCRSEAEFFRRALEGFSSGNYRILPGSANAQLSDTVPVALRPEFLQPGCINYITGHVLVLARVTPWGDLGFLHSSTTRGGGVFAYNGMNTVYGFPAYGDRDGPPKPRFEGLRVYRFPWAEVNEHMRVVSLRRRTDAEMVAFGYSLEQFDAARRFEDEGRLAEDGFEFSRFHDFLRYRMRSGERVPVLRLMETYADELIGVFRLREEFVQGAWRDYLENGPITYPENLTEQNIFQAHGRWETWSSPSSDVDRRNSYFELRDWALYVVRWFNEQPAYFDLSGLDAYEIRSRAAMAHALVGIKNLLFSRRSMTYSNSRGELVRLTLLDIEARLHDLSFDPNHPPELRWGAPEDSDERRRAVPTFTPTPDGAQVTMEEAYALETYYRSVSRRKTGPTGLRGMEGTREFRLLFDDALAEWYPLTTPSDAILSHFGDPSKAVALEAMEAIPGPADGRDGE